MTQANVLEFELQRLLLESMTHDLGNLATTISFLATRKSAGATVDVPGPVLAQVASDVTNLLRSQRAIVYGNLLGWSALPASRTASEWCGTFTRCLTSLTNPGSNLDFRPGSVDIPSAREATMMMVTGACICHIERTHAGHSPHEMSVSLDQATDDPSSCVLRFGARPADHSLLRQPQTTSEWLDLAMTLCDRQGVSPVISRHELEFSFCASFLT